MNPFKKLKYLALFVFSACLIAVLFHAFLNHLGLRYPFNTYLFDPTDRWADFYGTVEFNEYLDPFHNTFRGYRANYPPFSYAALAIFTNIIPSIGVYLYAITTSLVVFAFFVFLGRRLKGLDSSAKSLASCIGFSILLCAFSYPFQFAIDRMNAELLIFAFIAIGIILHTYKFSKLAAVSIGLAAAMKIYPGAFALIFLYEKNYRAFLLSVLTSIAATAIALVIFQITPFEVLEVYRTAAPSYAEMMAGTMPMAYSNTLFALVRAIQYKMDYSQAMNLQFAAQTMKTYSIVSATIGVVVLGASFAPGLKLFERLLLVVLVILLIPIVSFDYKLLHLFIPLYFWLIEPADKPKREAFVLVFFAIMLSPTAYKVIHANVTSSTFVHIFVLSTMAIYLLGRSISGIINELQEKKKARLVNAEKVDVNFGKGNFPRLKTC